MAMMTVDCDVPTTKVTGTLMACGMGSLDCTVTSPVEAPRGRPAALEALGTAPEPVPASGLAVSQLAPGTTAAVHCGDPPVKVRETSVGALRKASATARVTVWGATVMAAGAAEAAARGTLSVVVTVGPISLIPLTV